MPDSPDYPPHFPDERDYSASEPSGYFPSASMPGRSFGDRSSGARTPRRVAGRMLPASREDRVLRLLLTEAETWDKLSTEEHHLLVELPEPHGPLFVWLESQLHEHGPQPWAALREGLRGHPHERHATTQIAQIPEGIESDWTEVRSILDQLLRLHRQREMSELATRAATDPAARQRYLELAASLKAAAETAR